MKHLFLVVTIVLAAGLLVLAKMGAFAGGQPSSAALVLRSANPALTPSTEAHVGMEAAESGLHPVEAEPTRADRAAVEVSDAQATAGTGTLFGQVLDSAGHVAQFQTGELRLRFRPADPDSLDGVRAEFNLGPSHTVPIPQNGEFEVSHLEVGAWTVTCKVDGSSSIETTVLIPRDGERVRHDFVFFFRLVRLSLHDEDGQQLIRGLTLAGSMPNVSLGAFVTTEQPVIGSEAISNGGALSFNSHVFGKTDKDPWCELRFEWDRVCWAGVELGDRILAFGEVLPGVEDLLIVLPARELTKWLGALDLLVVDDASSSPLDRAQVSLTGSRGGTKRECDANGQTLFERLPAGQMTASVKLMGFLPASKPITITAGLRTRVEIRMEHEATVSGTARDEQGLPFTRLLIAVPNGEPPTLRSELVQDHPDRSTLAMLADPSADGSFVFRGLSRREYAVMDASRWSRLVESTSFTKRTAPQGVTLVDTRAGSVTGLIVVSRLEDRNRPVETEPR